MLGVGAWGLGFGNLPLLACDDQNSTPRPKLKPGRPLLRRNHSLQRKYLSMYVHVNHKRPSTCQVTNSAPQLAARTPPVRACWTIVSHKTNNQMRQCINPQVQSMSHSSALRNAPTVVTSALTRNESRAGKHHLNVPPPRPTNSHLPTS